MKEREISKKVTLKRRNAKPREKKSEQRVVVRKGKLEIAKAKGVHSANSFTGKGNGIKCYESPPLLARADAFSVF